MVSKRGGIGIFSRDVIFLSKMCPSHTQLFYITLFVCTCSNSAMPLVAMYYLVRLQYYSSNRWAYFREKAPFATTSFKKGGGLAYFQGCAYFLEITKRRFKNITTLTMK